MRIADSLPRHQRHAQDQLVLPGCGTEDGRTGLGECTLANQEGLLEAEAARLAANVTGEDARARNRLARLIPHAPGGLVARPCSRPSSRRCGTSRRSARAAAAPVPRRRAARCGAALRQHQPRREPAQPRRLRRRRARAVAEGFRAVKLAPFEPLVWEDGRSPTPTAPPMPRAWRASPRCATRSGPGSR
jgi:galactonate dehydratase